MKRALAGLLCGLMVLAVMTGGMAAGVATEERATYQDFEGKRFSILVGSLFDEVADTVFSASEKLYFNNTVDEIEAVKLGKTDAALMDDVAAAQALAEGAYAGLYAIPVPLPELSLPYGVFSTDQAVIDQYNQFLREIEADGTLEAMQNRWLKAGAFDAEMPQIPLSGENGTLTVAIMATYPPFTFAAKDGTFLGFDIEQLRRFAAWLGKDVRFVDMDFGAMMAYVASGKADMGGSVYNTAERRESFVFSEPNYTSQTVLVAQRPPQAVAAPRVAPSAGWEPYVGTGVTYGCMSGDVYGFVAETALGAGTVIEYETIADGIIALRNGRIDAFVADYVDLWLPEILNESTDIAFLTLPLDIYASHLAPIFATEEMRGKFNAFIAQLQADGTVQRMFDFWFGPQGLG